MEIEQSGDGGQPGPSVSETTSILQSVSSGREGAAQRLLDLVYGELHRLAASYLARERADHTLQPTALVHEVYLKLVDQTRASVRDEAHFLAIAAQAMRRILVDHARARSSAKRGGAHERVELDPVLAPSEESSLDLLSVDRALERLRAVSERQARIVEMRFFGGLEVEAVARALEVSVSTVEREWRVARAWLYHELESGS